jgi:hypothetical protein
MIINPQFYKKITSNFQTTTRKTIRIREKLKEEVSSLMLRDKFLTLIALRIFSPRTTLARSFLHTMSRPENSSSWTTRSRRLLTNAAVAAPLIKNLPLKLVRILILRWVILNVKIIENGLEEFLHVLDQKMILDF